MNVHVEEIEQKHRSSALAIWENEGGAIEHDSMDDQYGRRIEADRTWTVYHVFTGVPAAAGGQILMGLSRSAATKKMISLNHRNLERRQERTALPPLTSNAPETAGQS